MIIEIVDKQKKIKVGILDLKKEILVFTGILVTNISIAMIISTNIQINQIIGNILGKIAFIMLLLGNVNVILNKLHGQIRRDSHSILGVRITEYNRQYRKTGVKIHMILNMLCLNLGIIHGFLLLAGEKVSVLSGLLLTLCIIALAFQGVVINNKKLRKKLNIKRSRMKKAHNRTTIILIILLIIHLVF